MLSILNSVPVFTEASSIDVSTNLGTIMDVAKGCVNFITTNNILVLFLVAGLVPLGFRIFRSAKRSVR